MRQFNKMTAVIFASISLAATTGHTDEGGMSFWLPGQNGSLVQYRQNRVGLYR